MAIIRREEGMLTPERAAWLLTYNTNNRPLRERKVLQMAEMMEKGEWLATDIPIIMYEPPDGGTPVLQDGQNRLAAIVLARVPVPIRVSWSDEIVFDVVDTHTPRSNQDRITTDAKSRNLGLSKVGMSAAQTALMLADFMYVEEPTYTRKTPQDRMAHYHDHLDEAVALHHYRNRYHNGHRYYPNAGTLAGALRIMRAGGEAGEDFLARVADRTGMEEGMPELAYLRWVDAKRGYGRESSKGTYAIWADYVEALIRAWNATVRGGRLTHSVHIVHTIPAALSPAGCRKGMRNGQV
jgi:hypothetical protein